MQIARLYGTFARREICKSPLYGSLHKLLIMQGSIKDLFNERDMKMQSRLLHGLELRAMSDE